MGVGQPINKPDYEMEKKIRASYILRFGGWSEGGSSPFSWVRTTPANV
jgi:hypothetical protein